MDFLFLGTGAADMPDEMRNDPLYKIEDKSIRRCTSTLLDGKILIDAGPHAFAAARHFGVDVGDVRAVVLTHLHGDHYNLDTIRAFADAADSPLTLYYAAGAEIPDIPHTEKHPVAPLTTFSVCGYAFTALPANHTAHPYHYLIESSDARVLYALDGAWIMYDAFYAIKGKRLNLWIVDATVGDYTGDYRVGEHNSIPMIRLMEQSLRTAGCVDGNTVVMLDHIARTLHKSYDETSAALAEDGYVVPYDGMRYTL